VSKNSHKPHDERRKPLRVIFDQVEEPFIVPFAKPAEITEIPEATVEEIETKNITLKVVTEFVPSIHFPSKFRKCRQRRNIAKMPYRKPFLFPSTPASLTEEPPKCNEPKPSVDISTFQWSAPLDSLMQTASNQIRMLTDHLVVQSNQEIKAICFKSVFPGDGCTTILLCAVRALTERKQRVLLIDTHNRHIDIPKQLNLSGDLDSGNEILTLHDDLGLWVWQESKSAEENMMRLAEIIATHREHYDLILLDSGSVTESPLMEFVEFWNRIGADGIVLVSNTKHPSEIPVSHIAERFRQHHIHLIGITENCV
jgi:Mrp family chromosome partitioning ATPase